MDNNGMMEITPEHRKVFESLLKDCERIERIDPNLYIEYDVKRGLRDSNGEGVLTGLTEISDVTGTKNVKGRKLPVDGHLYYYGYDVRDIVSNFEGNRFRFEETSFLLLFGKLPTADELSSFSDVLADLADLSNPFIRDVIMKATATNLMNSLMKSVLSLYSYDEDPDNCSEKNVLRQSLQLIAKMPTLACYAYQSYQHFKNDGNLMIKPPKKEYSVAENILYMLRDDGQFSALEAEVLDICLVIHAEHGGGNNSTFASRVVTSSGTDTYSAAATAIASLKGPKHGGANLQVQNMFLDIKEHINDWKDKEEVVAYLRKIANKEAFDKSGLIYGMGHAVYTLSDPRKVILKSFAERLAAEKGRMEEFHLYEMVEQESPSIITEKHQIFKPICANVDFYSGLVYDMLGIPGQMFTPIFAIARMSGWSAHRLEALRNNSKIIRPAYKYVGDHRQYQKIEDRK